MSLLQLAFADFQGNMSAGLQAMLESEEYANVTIAVEGKHLKAHQMVLSICSPYFHSLLQSTPSKHPIIFMKNVKYTIMKHLLRFMYEGQTHIEQEDLQYFIETAQELQIKWLTKGNHHNDSKSETNAPAKRPRSCTPQQNVPEPAITANVEQQKEAPSSLEQVAKRPKILYHTQEATTSDAVQPNVKIETENDSYREPIVEIIETTESPPNVSSTIGSGAKDKERFFVEIDQTCDQEDTEDHFDVIYLDDDDDEDLLEPMGVQPNTFQHALCPDVGKPVPVTFCTGRLGQNLIVYDYHYYKQFKAKSWSSWRCSKYSNQPECCKATLRLTNDEHIIFKNVHNHEAGVKSKTVDIISEAIYLQADESIIKSHTKTKNTVCKARNSI